MKNNIIKAATFIAILSSLTFTNSAQPLVFAFAGKCVKVCAYSTLAVVILDSYIYPDENGKSVNDIIKHGDEYYKKFKELVANPPALSTIANNVTTYAPESIETFKNTQFAQDIYDVSSKTFALIEQKIKENRERNE